MRGLMMDGPLTLVSICERARRYFPQVEVVSRRADGTLARTTYSTLCRRARQLAGALEREGLARGDRVATLQWNHAAHLEAYFGVPLAGGVVHPLNLRLHPDELAYIVNHAGDRFLLVDDVLLPVFERFRQLTRFERFWVVPCSGAAAGPDEESYDALVASASDDFHYPDFDENDAAAMFYTSGTTGRPKGVVYSHRSLVLHALALGHADSFAISHRDTALLVAPMFHANGWGMPHACALAGAKLVLLGTGASPEDLLDLMMNEGVTLACGVPTIWLGLLDALRRQPDRWKFPHSIRLPVGGAAPPESLIREIDRYGLRIRHAWGMTETSPLGTICHLKTHMLDWPEDRQYRVRALQGYAVPLVELRLMRPEGEVAWDGVTPGELEVRGPWIASSYYHAPEENDRWSADGWFRTGDVATIDSEGFVKIVDRSKDLIKSGGEWISSVDLENALMAHPAVREAAVVAVPHPKWQERPLAVVVLRPGASVECQDLQEFLAARFARWQLPDAFVFAGEIPRTSVGKFLKSQLRERYSGVLVKPGPGEKK
ncbi:MAG TPA: long-chain fatty acid--CoA ligase [Candidatus Acidoferrales bacterium]|nr:long-chain fatty acid--CoA ligase [Candidatus Acidoferrales bacterium]